MYTQCYYKSEPHHWGKVPKPATLLFNHLVCGIMPVIDRKPVSVDNDDEHHKQLTQRQGKNDPNNDYLTSLCIYPHRLNCSGSTGRCRSVDPWHDSLKGQSQSLQQIIQSHHCRENNYMQQKTHQANPITVDLHVLPG